MEGTNKQSHKLVICVDDVSPARGWGFRDQNIDKIFSLIEDFGCKFTLFVVPNLKSPELSNIPADLRLHADFVKDLNFHKYVGKIELAGHGYDHYSTLTDGREFLNLDRDLIKSKIDASIEIFKSVGVHPVGFKAPGWHLDEDMLNWLGTKFRWIGVNQYGTDPIHFAGIVMMPHTKGINEEINPNEDNILTSHINGGPAGSNKNAWTQENYEKIQKLLLSNQFEFMTMTEYLDYKSRSS